MSATLGLTVNGVAATPGQLLVDGDLIEATPIPGGVAFLEFEGSNTGNANNPETGNTLDQEALTVCTNWIDTGGTGNNCAGNNNAKAQWLWNTPSNPTALPLGSLAYVRADASTYSVGLLADPHIVCADGTRIDIYAPGFYRFYDNGQADPSQRLVVNIRVDQNTRGQDYAAAVWIKEGRKPPVVHTFEGKVFDSMVDGQERHLECSAIDPSTRSRVTFVLDGKYNSIGACFDDRFRYHHLGGLIAGRIVTIGSLDDVCPVPARITRIARWETNALVCGSGVPHIVSFHMKRIWPGAGTHTLLSVGQVTATAVFSSENRIRRLEVRREKEMVLQVVWVVDDETKKNRATWATIVGLFPSSSSAAGQDARPETLSLTTPSDVFETGVAIGDSKSGKSGNNILFVRVQSEEIVSFALLDASGLRGASGLLTEAEVDEEKREPCPATMASTQQRERRPIEQKARRPPPSRVPVRQPTLRPTAFFVPRYYINSPPIWGYA